MSAGQNGRVTLWGVEVFLAVAEEGSISAAARRVGVSASAISQQLAVIEAALGAPLVDRGHRPLTLTPAGALFRPHAQAMLNAEAEARAALTRADLSALATLRLGVIEDFDARVTPLLLSRLTRDMPTCRFHLETGPSHRLVDKLDSRALDLVISADYAAHSPQTEDWAEVHPLMQEPFIAILPMAGGGFDRPFIQYTTRHLMGRQIAAHLAGQGKRPAVRLELDSYRAILPLVGAGEGWTILTPLALHHDPSVLPQLRILPIGAPGLDLPPLARRLTLSLRRGLLGDLPQGLARIMRELIGQEVVRPAQAQMPWLGDGLRLL